MVKFLSQFLFASVGQSELLVKVEIGELAGPEIRPAWTGATGWPLFDQSTDRLRVGHMVVDAWRDGV